jgi:N-acetylneuraminic acid mutarotase
MRARPFARPFRPRLESLEGRALPSALAVADLGEGAQVRRTDGLTGGPAREVVFFEPTVADYQVLRQGLAAGAEAVVLDPAGDGLRQMAAFLAGRHGLAAVGVVAHGQPGAVALGATTLDGPALGAHAGDLAAVVAALGPGGELDLWSCDAAAGPAGRALVRGLAAATGAAVAASAHEVGSAERGGWSLEVRAGGAAAVVPFSAGARGAFCGVLGIFQPAAAMSTGRYVHTATLLGTGKVLVAGGQNDSGSLAGAELYDPVSNSWSPATGMGAARVYHTATLLGNGKVLVVGGGGNGTIQASAELYDPASNSWSYAGSMSTGRSAHTATLLGSGKVLVAGGSNGGALSSAEMYDPASNSWSPAGSMSVARFYHTATLLVSGKVLVAGGEQTGAGSVSSAELYDPGSNSWLPASSLRTARSGATATLLGNGKVLVAGGGRTGSTGTTALASAELYDPASNSWFPAAPMSAARYQHTATLLGNGKVVVAGGISDSGALSSAELYDSPSNTWSPAASMSTSRSLQTATLLANGKVLVAGGNGTGTRLSSAELYVEGATTTTTLSTSASPSLYGQMVTFTAAVTSSGAPVTSGTVTFREGGTVLASAVALDGTGHASFITTALSAAATPHVITADYGGNPPRYVPSSGGVSQTVNRAPLTVTADDKTKVYGEANPALTAHYAGFVLGEGVGVLSGTLSLSTAATTASGAGSYPITAAGTLSAANYDISYANGTLTVTRAALTVTADDKSKVYGQPNPALTATYTGFVLGEGPGSLGGTLVLSTAPPTSGAGTYPITAGGLTSANYSISYVSGTLTVSRAPLTVTADDKTKVAGDPPPALTASFTGLVNGDTAASLLPSLALGSTGATSTVAGTYPITVGGTLADYSPTFANGTLTVVPAGASSVRLAAPATAVAGSAFAFQVTALDRIGNTATGYRGTAAFGLSDPQGFGPADYPFTAADAGTHAFGAVFLTAGTGTLSVRDAADSALAGSTSVAVSAAAASQLRLSAPAFVTADVPFAFTVSARDRFGNVAAGYRGTVQLTSSDGTPLGPDYAFTATDGGQHAFSATLPAVGAVTLTAADAGAGFTASATVNVTEPAAGFLFTAVPSAVTAGEPFAVTVQAVDRFGDLVPGYLGAVTVSSDDPQGNAVTHTFVAADRGSYTFPGLVLGTAGTADLFAGDGALFGSAAVAVNPGQAAFLVLSPPDGTTAGAAFSLTVVAYDVYYNVATGYAGAVALTSDDPLAPALGPDGAGRLTADRWP